MLIQVSEVVILVSGLVFFVCTVWAFLITVSHTDSDGEMTEKVDSLLSIDMISLVTNLVFLFMVLLSSIL